MVDMISRAIRNARQWLFKPAARYPADPRAVFILALSVFGGLTAMTLQVAPQSLDSLLPHWALILWGLILTAGSALALGGMLFQTLNGIIVEQIGSVMVGAATVFYSGVALWVVGISTVQNLGIVLAWGLACFARWAQLQVLVHSAVLRKQKLTYLEQLFSHLEDHERRRVIEREMDR